MTPSTEDTERLLAETGWLRDLARCLVAGKDLADDVAQETLLRAWRRPAGSVQNLRGWLAAVAQSVARRFARTEQRQRRRLQALGPRDHEVSAAEVCERTQRQRDVMDAALRLAEPGRSAVLLRFQGGLSYAEIAQRLGVPIETVRTRIKRGLAQLRGELDGRHGGTQAWALPVLGIGWQGGGVAAAGVLLMATLGKVAAVLVVAAAVWVVVPWSEADLAGRGEPSVQVDRARSIASAANVAQGEARSAAVQREPVPDAEGTATTVGAERDLLLRFGELCDIVGRVVDADTAAPVEGAKVEFARVPVEIRREQTVANTWSCRST